ncbi:DUF2512 family protein [Scopulibacillus cellulosilyticus]|uniref:DUF2512 family protein n=1 Tax=Scopulibacillus cellulosilyticus TaxID=2665665 RepID=A0ABW2PUM8_9BACL
MVNFILKIVLTPVIIVIADLFSNVQINYGTAYEAVIMGVIVGLINFAVELLLFRRGTFWITTVADFVITMFVVFFGSNIFTDAYVGALGAFTVSLIITVLEYFLHFYVLKEKWQTRMALR